MDAPIKEMCSLADISEFAYGRYMRAHPDFRIHLERLRDTPTLRARRTAVKKIPESYSNAMDYLKRKRRAEFGDYTKHEHEGIVRGAIGFFKIDDQKRLAIKEAKRENVRIRATEEIDEQLKLNAG